MNELEDKIRYEIWAICKTDRVNYPDHRRTVVDDLERAREIKVPSSCQKEIIEVKISKRRIV